MLVEMLRALLRKSLRDVGSKGKYRPERHYMRGPGPKSKAREDIGQANMGQANVGQTNNAKA